MGLLIANSRRVSRDRNCTPRSATTKRPTKTRQRQHQPETNQRRKQTKTPPNRQHHSDSKTGQSGCRYRTRWLTLYTLSITSRQSKARLAQVDKQIAEISAEIGRFISSCDTLAHSMKILRSIPGIGAVCAATILIEMPEIGRLDRKQVAS
jgi:transposase